MNPGAFKISLSAIDERRFGFRTARADELTLESLPEAIDFCQTHSVEWLIARCRVDQLKAVQAMERDGFSLMDTLVYFRRDLGKTTIPPNTGKAVVRPVRAGEEHAVEAIAKEAFRGYFGHYHADERLEPAKCDAVYPSWARRSCVSRDVADEVLVAVLDGSIAGFLTLRINSPDEVEAALVGVAASAQRQGVHRSLLIGRLEWVKSMGATNTIGSTQLTNMAVQKNLVRLEFEPSHAFYTFHKWFDS